GLDSVPADQRPTIPEVNVVHLAWDLMVGIGTVLALLSVWFALTWLFQRDMPRTRWFLRIAAAAGVLSVLALEAGWVVTEGGGQRGIASTMVTVPGAATENRGVWVTFLTVAAVYVVVAVTTVLVLRIMSRRFADAGPGDEDVPYGPRPAPAAVSGDGER